MRLREAVGKEMGRIMGLGNVESAGVMVPKRGAYFALKDIDQEYDLWNLLGGEILDACSVQANPIMSLETLGKWFRDNPVR